MLSGTVASIKRKNSVSATSEIIWSIPSRGCTKKRRLWLPRTTRIVTKRRTVVTMSEHHRVMIWSRPRWWLWRMLLLTVATEFFLRVVTETSSLKREYRSIIFIFILNSNKTFITLYCSTIFRRLTQMQVLVTMCKQRWVLLTV